MGWGRDSTLGNDPRLLYPCELAMCPGPVIDGQIDCKEMTRNYLYHPFCLIASEADLMGFGSQLCL